MSLSLLLCGVCFLRYPQCVALHLPWVLYEGATVSKMLDVDLSSPIEDDSHASLRSIPYLPSFFLFLSAFFLFPYFSFLFPAFSFSPCCSPSVPFPFHVVSGCTITIPIQPCNFFDYSTTFFQSKVLKYPFCHLCQANKSISLLFASFFWRYSYTITGVPIDTTSYIICTWSYGVFTQPCEPFDR